MARRITYNSMLIKALGIKYIQFNPALAKLASDVKAGLFLSQLLYWINEDGKPIGRKTGWIYKTIKEMEIETCLSRKEQETAIKKWKKLNILQVKLFGIPAKRHFSIDTDKLINKLSELYQK